MSFVYPINSPVNFVNTNGGTDTLNFNADGPTTNLENKIENFVTTSPGDMLYRAAGANNYLERLPIGAPTQFLTVIGGLPAWSGLPVGQGGSVAFITGSVAPIPTSCTGSVDADQWFPLSGNFPYVTWSTAFPGHDPDGAFSLIPGPTYGTYVALATGIYLFTAAITFDLGPGVNGGSGITTSSPTGTSIRQIELFNLTTSTVLATNSVQASPSSNNTTTVSMVAISIPLNIGDRITIRVRHDRSSPNTLTIGNTASPTSTYFSGGRSR
jgi:hypothetical protein